LAQLQRSIVRAEKNRVAQTFGAFAKSNPDPKLWELDKKHMRNELDPHGNVVQVQDRAAYDNDYSYKVGGEQHRVTIHDPGLLRAMKNVSAQETGRIVHAIGAATRLYSSLVTTF